MKKILFIYIQLFTLLIACTGGKKSIAANPWYGKTYAYVDGNGNRYMISRESFEYIPTTPGESSSGRYSGGTAVKNKPSHQNFYRLADLIQQASEARGDQTEKLEMGTGRIEIREGTTATSFILRMGSPWIQQIEAVLTEMKEVK